MKVSYQHAEAGQLHRLAIEGDRQAERELERRERISELQAEAMAMPFGASGAFAKDQLPR